MPFSCFLNCYFLQVNSVSVRTAVRKKLKLMRKWPHIKTHCLRVKNERMKKQVPFAIRWGIIVFWKRDCLCGVNGSNRVWVNNRLRKNGRNESGYFRGLVWFIHFQVDVNERTTISFFATMIIVVFRCVIACVRRDEVEVGKMSATVMQMQLHTYWEQRIHSYHRYEQNSLHEFEGTLFQLIHNIVLVIERNWIGDV